MCRGGTVHLDTVQLQAGRNLCSHSKPVAIFPRPQQSRVIWLPSPGYNLPELVGFIKGHMREKDTACCYRQKTAVRKPPFLSPPPSLMIQVVQAFSLMSQGWRT